MTWGTGAICIWAFGVFVTMKTPITSLKKRWKFGIIVTCLGLSMNPNIPLSTSWRQRRQCRIGSALNFAPGCLGNRWLDSIALLSAGSCSNTKCRTCNSKRSTLVNMHEHWRISNQFPWCSFRMTPSSAAGKQPSCKLIHELTRSNAM